MRTMWGFAGLVVPAVALAAQTADFAAPVALVKSARDFADITAGVSVKAGGDKVVFLGGTLQDVRVIAIQVVPATGGSISEQAGTLAILRTRRAAVERPTIEDRSLAEARGISVFIVGEWKKPGPMWEIGREHGTIMFRPVDKNGVTGAWQPWP